MVAHDDDPCRAPQPLGGWSTKIVTVPQALVVPATVADMVQPMGVFDAEGAYVHEGVLWRGRRLMVEPEPRPEPVAELPGRWIWGGVLLNHFGHFLVESTPRLWALDALKGAVDGFVFTVKRETIEVEGELKLQPFQRLFFDLLGIDVPIRILAQPTRVECLEVPGQGFGLGAIAAGTEPFRAFFQSRFARDIAPQGAEKLYISRSALGASRGGVLGEDRIEAALAAAGYEIFHPQKHSLEAQIAHYKAARQVVALDGSALHMVAMVGRTDQQVAMIRRRVSDVSDSIVTHLTAFTGRAPLVIDVIEQDWVRSDRKRADRHSVGQLDLPALGRALVAGGFLPDGTEIPAMSEADIQAGVHLFEDALSGKLRFEPLARGARRELPEADGGARRRKDKSGTKPGKEGKLKGEERRAARMARQADKTERREKRAAARPEG
ncbi:glycosyltransferase family 61 protein [Rhodobacter capsulatus]|uniref:glycosyltransferase family 61 protein n=1 Tax=Rhodobacter capsulatus TaxID=1061 RepID=UPI004028B257